MHPLMTGVIFAAFAVVAANGLTLPSHCPQVKLPTKIDATVLATEWWVQKYYNTSGLMPDVKCMKRIAKNVGGIWTLRVESIDVATKKKIITDNILDTRGDSLIFKVKDTSEYHVILGVGQEALVVMNCLTVNGVDGYIIMYMTKNNNNKLTVQMDNFLKEAGLGYIKLKPALQNCES